MPEAADTAAGTAPDGPAAAATPDRAPAAATPDGPLVDPALVQSVAAAAAGVAAATGRRLVVLVDGRSGTGKTTFAAALAPLLGATVVHLDDVYPGWDGLAAASAAVVDDVLGAPSGHRRWDWATSAPAEWVAVDDVGPLVVEGCGALSRRSAPLAVLRLWLEGDDVVRERRAIARDGAVFAREWSRWAAQEDAVIAAEDPAALADLLLTL